MDRQEADDGVSRDQPIARRTLLRGVGVGAVAAGAGGVLSACGSSGIKGAGSSSATGTIKIGFVTPLTGDLSDFGASDRFVVNTVRQVPAYAKGFKAGGKHYSVSIVVQDSQSSPTRAGQVAKQLILQDHVDVILTTSAPETTNPVASECQKLGTPCVSTVVPWESWYGGLGGNPVNPTTSFEYCTMFFFGMKEFQGCFVPMWNRIPNNRQVACMFPNDTDGNAFRAAFEPLIKASGYKVVDGGAYADGMTDFTSMISKFKSANCELFSNAPLPPDFNTMWKQASQQGFKPKLATVAKVLLFPADVAALGPLVTNIATDSWWGPYLPYTSSLDGQSATSLADAYQTSTGSEWTQSVGSSYSLFEVAQAALTKVSDPHDKKEVANELHHLSYKGISGAINFGSGPAPGVGITPPLGVQWKKSSGKYPFEMLVVDNSLNKDVKIQAKLEPTNA